MTKTDYDSTEDTQKHIEIVRVYLDACAEKLYWRSREHDKSKLEEPEKSFFDKYTPLLVSLEYGSDEYKQALIDLQPALQYHYEANRHHPEHFSYWLCLGVCGKKWSASELMNIGNVATLCPECGCSVHYEQIGVDGMNLFDVVEMLMDWKAASERQSNGDIRRSLETSITRFKLSPQLASILLNTIEAMGW